MMSITRMITLYRFSVVGSLKITSLCLVFSSCLPWCYIDPLDLLKKSVMSEEILLVVQQIRLWLIDRACKNRWVAKEVVTDDDFENTVSIMLIPLLCILVSHCTGGAHSTLKTASRLVAPGVAECHVLLPIYYVLYSSISHENSGFVMPTQYDKAVDDVLKLKRRLPSNKRRWIHITHILFETTIGYW